MNFVGPVEEVASENAPEVEQDNYEMVDEGDGYEEALDGEEEGRDGEEEGGEEEGGEEEGGEEEEGYNACLCGVCEYLNHNFF
jgi:neurofilament light polypeptide